MIGVSTTITLKGKKEEERFFSLWHRAMDNIHLVPGLQTVDTAKVLGKEYTYHIFSLWHSEEYIEDWLENPVYHQVLRNQGLPLMEKFVSYRWQPIREPIMIRNKDEKKVPVTAGEKE